MNDPIELREVRFLVYHQGMGADVGQTMHVSAEWAERAIERGVVEAVEPAKEPAK